MKAFTIGFALSSILCFAAPAHAELMVFTGDGGQKLTMEKASAIKSDAWVVKLEGVDTPWSGKPIVLHEQKRPSADRYVFEYERKGQLDGEYQMLVAGSITLKGGTITKTMKVYYKGGDRDKPLVTVLDADATKAAKAGALIAEAKKSPYTPQM